MSFSFGRRTGGGFEVATVVEAQRVEKERIAQRKQREDMLRRELEEWEEARKQEDERIAAELSRERRRSSTPGKGEAAHGPGATAELPSVIGPGATFAVKLHEQTPVVLKSIASDETAQAVKLREQQQNRRAVCRTFGFPEVWVSAQTAKTVEKINSEVQNAAYNVGCAKVFTPASLQNYQEIGLPCLSDKMLAPVIEEVVRQHRSERSPSRVQHSRGEPGRRGRKVTMVAVDPDSEGREAELEETLLRDLPSTSPSRATEDPAAGSGGDDEPPTIEHLVLPPEAITSLDLKRPPVAVDAASILRNVLFFASFGVRNASANLSSSSASKVRGESRSGGRAGNRKINDALLSLLDLDLRPNAGSDIHLTTPAVELTQNLFWFVFAAFFHHRLLPTVVTQAFPRMAECFALVHLAAANDRLLNSNGMVLEKQSVGASPIDYVCCTLVHAVCLAFVVVFPKNHHLFTVDFCNRACSLMFLALLGRDTDSDYWENNRRLHFSHSSISIDDVAGAASLAAARALSQ